MKSNVKKMVSYIKTKVKNLPDFAIILGSGFYDVLDSVENKIEIPYTELKDFYVLGPEKETGKFIFGKIGVKNVVIMVGRLHYHNGYEMPDMAAPIFFFKELGCSRLLITASVGAINKRLSVGDVIDFVDQINFSGKSPLIGYKEMIYGHKFIDMTLPYDGEMNFLIRKIAREDMGIKVKDCVYIEFMGPNGETSAEAQLAKMLGADVVGFNVISEVIACRYCDMKVATIGLVTNFASAYSKGKVKHEDIVFNRKCASGYFTDLITQVITKI